MIVSELIELLKTFPQDAKVAAFDTTQEMEIILKGGVVLEEEDNYGVINCELPANPDGTAQMYIGPWVSIVGGRYTQHGWIDNSGYGLAEDDAAEEELNLAEEDTPKDPEVPDQEPSDRPLPSWWIEPKQGE